MSLSLIAILTLNGLYNCNRGLDAAVLLLAIFQRLETTLKLPEHTSSHLPVVNPKNSLEAHGVTAGWKKSSKLFNSIKNCENTLLLDPI